MRIDVCVSLNREYIKYLYVMLLSLFESNKGNYVHVFALEKELKHDDKLGLSEFASKHGGTIDFIDVDPILLVPIEKKGIGNYPIEALFRFYIPEVIPKDVKRLLYLDVDVIVRKRLDELFCVDFEDGLFAVCEDIYMPLTDSRKQQLGRTEGLYFNSGVMLWNMERIREKFSVNTFVDAAMNLEGVLESADQEVFNYLFYDKVKTVDPYCFNYLVAMDIYKGYDYREYDPVILHFAGRNPWKPGRRTEAYMEWWSYAKKTPYINEIMSGYIENTDNCINEQLDRIDELSDLYGDALEKAQYYFELSRDYSFLYRMTEGDEFDFDMGYEYVIYGAGRMGKLLYYNLERRGLSSGVKAFVDQSNMGLIEGIEVFNDITKFDKENYCIIVTPVNGNAELVRKIRDEMEHCNFVISMGDFLKKGLGR